MTNRINHDRIDWHGSSPQGIEQPDFVWSEDNWFRPVDIELGPDGALYIADFYNRIIGHYEVPLTHPGRDRERGRVWRIVYKGTDGKPAALPTMTDRTKSSVDELVADLANPNLVVRIAAANQLVERGGEAAIAAVRTIMRPNTPARQRVHGLWVLERRGNLDDATLAGCAADPDRELRVHSMKVLVDRPELTDPLAKLTLSHLSDTDPFVRRAAAEVLGAHPSAANVRPLLSLRQSTSAEDTHLIHVARIALRDQLKNPAIWSGLDALGLTERDRRDIADVATGVHTSESAAFLVAHLHRHREDQHTLLRFAHHIARYGAPNSVAEAVRLATDEKRTPAERLDLLKSIQEGAQERGAGLDEQSRTLALGLARQLLGSSVASEITLGVDVVRDFRFRDLDPAIKNVIIRHDLPESTRMHAMAALTAIDPRANLAVVGNVLADASAPIAMRERAANLLGNVDLAEAKTALLSNLATAPERLQSAIAAIPGAPPRRSRALLEAIGSGKASARLLQQRPVTISLESSGVPRVAERISSLLKGLPPADAKLSALYASRRDGFQTAKADPGLGAKVFEKNCEICHQLGGKGAKVGPQLDGIGSRGFDRLMEDVLDPNRNVDQTFRLTTIALKNGQVVSGLLLREEGEVLIVADSQGKDVRIPKSTVDERSISPLSPMPANLTDQISANDFYHLMAYLLSRREPSEIPPTGSELK